MIGQTVIDVISTLLDVLIVYYVIYRVLLIIKGTRAVPMLMGLVALVLLYFLSQKAYVDLPTFNWLLEQFINSLFLIVVVLFQSDIRRALAAFGRTQFLTGFRSGQGAHVIDELVKAANMLARQHIGALIVVEREGDLGPYMEEGTLIDAKVSKELLYSLFVPDRQNPLHDGAVVVRRGRVEAAGIFLPMSVNPNIERTLGTRHRAALGISEETDALIIVVSEERGTVSLGYEGKLSIDVGATDLRERLTDLLLKRADGSGPRRMVRALTRGKGGDT
ncbi:MAG: diadenylate cyclase [Bradymonadia bacterium]|jgi:diadenylate cyclase